MDSTVYYQNFKKIRKEKFSDTSIFLKIKSMLREGSFDENTRLFLESLANYFKEHKVITLRQLKALEKIEKVFSEYSEEEHKKWQKEYGDDERAVAIICANYYKLNPPYFSYLIDDVLNNPDFIPTKKQYQSMCENKYAKKVIRETYKDPVFKPGTLVQGRVNAPDCVKDKIATVISINDKPIKRAARGSKIYFVLPVGEQNVVECEERHLKKSKRA